MFFSHVPFGTRPPFATRTPRSTVLVGACIDTSDACVPTDPLAFPPYPGSHAARQPGSACPPACPPARPPDCPPVLTPACPPTGPGRPATHSCHFHRFSCIAMHMTDLHAFLACIARFRVCMHAATRHPEVLWPRIVSALSRTRCLLQGPGFLALGLGMGGSELRVGRRAPGFDGGAGVEGSKARASGPAPAIQGLGSKAWAPGLSVQAVR